MTTISLLGSTGSIGRQALDIIGGNSDVRAGVLAAGRNAALLEEQARRFLPQMVCAEDEEAGRLLKTALADTPVKVFYGAQSIIEAARHPDCGTVLNAITGLAGFMPTMAALNAGKRLLLANKESLVCGGALVTNAAKRGIIPVDSEHSAIFQCLESGRDGLTRVILTATGGPFRGYTREQLQTVTPDMALAHPTWRMGAKITLECATLLNKGLELIEAMHLFALPFEAVGVVLHPQSIIHSLAEYTDGAMLAQLAHPDMRLPIQYALTYPKRLPCPVKRLDLAELGTLTFEQPDRKTFRCLALAERAAREGGNMGAVLCGAGEAAAEAFLAGRCGFLDIAERIERALDDAHFIKEPTADDITASAQAARKDGFH